MKLYTDFGASRHEFIEKIVSFYSKRPGSIIAIDMSDVNRFETSMAGRFVARFEFAADGPDAFLDDGTIDFVMSMADAFNKLRLPDKTSDKNVRRRANVIVDGTGLSAEDMLNKFRGTD